MGDSNLPLTRAPANSLHVSAELTADKKKDQDGAAFEDSLVPVSLRGGRLGNRDAPGPALQHEQLFPDRFQGRP